MFSLISRINVVDSLMFIFLRKRSPLNIIWIFLCFFTGLSAQSDFTHPHILVRPEDRVSVLHKISSQEWAKKAYQAMRDEVDGYVQRHQKDSAWILSRYLMNRIPGKRYTTATSDPEGTALIGYSGDAPFPTVRVSSHKRAPVAPDGHGYRQPRIEELIPEDTSMTMLLRRESNPEIRDRVDPQTFIDNINGRINNLALSASILYWLTQDASYAKFAADILSQWARGAYYQKLVEGPCRTGFLSIQSIGDGAYEPMPLVYDFLYDWMRDHHYELKWYEPVFQRMAEAMTFRGFWNNNWFAAQMPLLAFSVLSIEDDAVRNTYLDYYFNRDTIQGACGHLSMPSLITRHFTADGHWKEPGGYHNFPVSSLLIASLAMERNGFDVFRKYPTLFQASHAMLKYSFPNLKAPTIGDTGPVSQSAECLEIGLLFARKYDKNIYDQLASSMQLLMQQNGYQRSQTDFLGLLCYLPDFSDADPKPYEWPRSVSLDFAKCFIQRNGMDRKYGMMYAVQGASYNHNHANGMAVELYGKGSIMAPDPGKGIHYEAPLHVNYYAQWAAHNTVISGGQSTSVPPVKGGGGTKQMGAIRLAAMEPFTEKKAISPYVSFTDTRYTDISTNTQQQRTLAILRTTDTTAYYIDIYRSNHPSSNEYVYHNIGDSVFLETFKGKRIGILKDSIPLHQDPFDPPGLRIFESVHRASQSSGIARFRERNNYMQAILAPESERTLFTVYAPPTKTADLLYREKPTPTIVWRQTGQAQSRPFIALYEPYEGDRSQSVDSMKVIDRSDPGSFSVLEVIGNKNSGTQRQMIFQAIDGTQMHTNPSWSFQAHFAVANMQSDKLQYLYLGHGKHFSYGGYQIDIPSGSGDVHLEIEGQSFLISCNQTTEITIQGKSFTKVRAEGQSIQMDVRLDGVGTHISVPAVQDLRLILGK